MQSEIQESWLKDLERRPKQELKELQERRDNLRRFQTAFPDKSILLQLEENENDVRLLLARLLDRNQFTEAVEALRRFDLPDNSNQIEKRWWTDLELQMSRDHDHLERLPKLLDHLADFKKQFPEARDWSKRSATLPKESKCWPM